VGLGALFLALSLIGTGIQARTSKHERRVIGATAVVGQDGKILAGTRDNIEHTSMQEAARRSGGFEQRTRYRSRRP